VYQSAFEDLLLATVETEKKNQNKNKTTKKKKKNKTLSALFTNAVWQWMLRAGRKLSP